MDNPIWTPCSYSTFSIDNVHMCSELKLYTTLPLNQVLHVEYFPGKPLMITNVVNEGILFRPEIHSHFCGKDFFLARLC